MGITRNVRDTALGAATVTLLIYAAVTAGRNFSGAMPEPARIHAACPGAGASCRNDALQLARSRDP